MSDVMFMWTVYAHPIDYPDQFVARKFEIGRNQFNSTADVIVADTLEQLRAKRPPGLLPLARAADDEPHIVEVWL